MSLRNIFRLAAILTIVSVLNGPASAPVNAMEQFVSPIPGHIPNIASVAVGVVPDYEGSDDYTFGVLPALNLTFDNRYFRLLGNYLGINIVNNDIFEFGPSAYYRFSRDDDINDDVVTRIHEVDDALEMGAFAGVVLRDKTNPRRAFIANLEFLSDISDTHDGYIVQLSARGWMPVSRPVDLGIAGGGTYASDDYMSAYFGVTATDSARSGLAIFDAGSGVKDVYIQPMMMIHLSESWHIGAAIRIKFLLSDAADSPVVDIQGSDTQVIGGIGVAYAW
jgi:outer membrane protein